MQTGRGLAVIANKWDLVVEKDPTYKELVEAIAVFSGTSVWRTSALTGAGVTRLPTELVDLHERWGRRVPTSEVNRVLSQAQDERPPPAGVRYRYGTQVSAGPPTFVLFGGRAPSPSYARFLEGRLRRAFGLGGVPIRLRFRAKRPRGGGR
jgi:GTP-binding protein